MEIENKSVRTHSFFICLLLIMAIYLPVNYFGFVNMDDAQVFERFQYNEAKIDFSNMFFRTCPSRYYRPLLFLSFYLDSRVWGLSMAGYHFTNYFFHILNAILVYLIALKLFSQDVDKKLYAGFAMLLFGLHPLTCESVAWVSGRSDIAGTFFFLLAVNFYFIRNPFRFILTPLAVFLGMLCKENALAGIPLVVLLDLFVNFIQNHPGKDILKKTMIWTVVMTIPFILYLFLRTNGWETNGHASFLMSENTVAVSGTKRNFFQFFHVFPVIAFYLKKLVVPFPLNFAISRINTLVYSILFFAFCMFNVFWCFRKKISFILWSMILVISFIPALPVAFGAIAWVPFAERYLYLSVSVAGICMAACVRFFVQKGYLDKKKQWIVFIALTFIFSMATLNREFVWKSSQALWADTLKKNPDSSMVLFKYGQTFGGEAEILAYKKAITLSRDFKYKDLTLLGMAEYEKSARNYDKAVAHINMALHIKKNFKNLCQAAEIVLSIAADDCLWEKEYTARAIQCYQMAYKKHKSAFVLFRIGTLMKRTGRQAEAIKKFNAVIQNHPHSKYAFYAKLQLKKMESYQNTVNPENEFCLQTSPV